jgi:hypothetical protein
MNNHRRLEQSFQGTGIPGVPDISTRTLDAEKCKYVAPEDLFLVVRGRKFATMNPAHGSAGTRRRKIDAREDFVGTGALDQQGKRSSSCTRQSK